MTRFRLAIACFLPIIAVSQVAHATCSAELYTATSYPYGRFEARARLAAGDGVVSSFFLWKEGSEQTGAFWNELDFEKVAAECRLETNPIYGQPSANHSQRQTLALDLCGAFHTYAYEWTPDAVAWLIDGTEIRRETGATAKAFADNASAAGMRIHLNLWPGDASFGGNFNPSILPVHQYIDWVQYSKYENGTFSLTWREDFNGSALPADWLAATWSSPKNLSTHSPQNVNFIDGYAVLSLTRDDALGPAGAMPLGTGGASSGGTNTGGAGAGATGAGATSAGSTANGGSTGSAGASGLPAAGSTNLPASGGMPQSTGGTSPANGATSPPSTTSGSCSVGGGARGGHAMAGLALFPLAWLLRRRTSRR